MKENGEKAYFLGITRGLLRWYDLNQRKLPWRKSKDPYSIWISEVILQQTRVQQGGAYYERFIERFPSVQSLYQAQLDDVMLLWKGLGYYSRALNLHEAAKQIVENFGGVFPSSFKDIVRLKGIGKYTAAAISSICFNESVPAVDGNFYRVLSRIFADEFDISSPKSYVHFYELAKLLIDPKRPGDFNQAVMDLGASLCGPKLTNCSICPVSEYCLSFRSGTQMNFPVKKKKLIPRDVNLVYYFVSYQSNFLISRRDQSFIWKKLYDFPNEIPKEWKGFVTGSTEIYHKLTHRNLRIKINEVELLDEDTFRKFAIENEFITANLESARQKSFPKPLEKYLESFSVKRSSANDRGPRTAWS